MDKDISMAIKMGSKSFQEIKELYDGKRIDETPLYDLCDFINYRLDCSDFRMMTILKVIYEFSDLISVDTTQKIGRAHV